MAGHSQFANIKHRKNAQDDKRSRRFLKLSKEITNAVKLHGNNITSNAKLRFVLEQARILNMPKENITRAITRANSDNVAVCEEIIYEAYIPGGVAFLVFALTDNRNRTASNVRSYFNKFNGHLATIGSVKYLFDQVGMINFKTTKTIEEIFEIVLNYNIIDIKILTDGTMQILTSIPELLVVKKALEEEALVSDFLSCEITYVSQTMITIDAPEVLSKINNLVELLKNDDDIQDVVFNVNLDD